MASPDERPGSPFTVEIDGEEYTTNETEMTEHELVALGGRDPADYELVRIQGNQRVPVDGPVKINSGLRFVTVATGATPVA